MSEWVDYYGGKEDGRRERPPLKPLPFYCCSLGLTEFENPVCTVDGHIYDVINIIPWIKKYKSDPVTGKPLAAKDLFKVKFTKNDQGIYWCPLSMKDFNDRSHIVVIKPSGNVYSFEAVDNLNIKPNNWKDVLTGEEFTKEDIITIQDPNNLLSRAYGNFFHVRESLSAKKQKKQNVTKNSSTDRIMNEFNKAEKERQDKKLAEMEARGEKPEEKPAASMIGVNAAPGFTSSAFSAKPKPADPRDVIIETKKKGYVRLKTNLGDLNLEIHSDLVPKTSENFLKHCASGYYDGTIFHRNIKGFMIQGGDPTGTGTGGQSIWGLPFKDEVRQNLLHDSRGVLSMANAGAHSNGSQFFITYRPAPHLNQKHSVFGRVVGGLDTLGKLEKVEVDEMDKPKTEIKIQQVIVFVNPFSEEELAKERAEQEAKDKNKRRYDTYIEEGRGEWFSNPALENTPKTQKTGIGKYMPDAKPVSLPPAPVADKDEMQLLKQRMKNQGKNQFNFGGW